MAVFTRIERGYSRAYRQYRRVERGRVSFAISFLVVHVHRAVSRAAQASLERYELFDGEDDEPDLAAAPAYTFTTLPFQIPAPADGVLHHFVLRRRNRFGLSSANTASWRVLPGGTVARPPAAPVDVTLTPGGIGFVRLRARYLYGGEGTFAATQWQVFGRTNGTTPEPTTDPATIVPVRRGDGVAKLDLLLPAAAQGVETRVLVRLRRLGPTTDSAAVVVALLTGPPPGTPDVAALLGRQLRAN